MFWSSVTSIRRKTTAAREADARRARRSPRSCGVGSTGPGSRMTAASPTRTISADAATVWSAPFIEQPGHQRNEQDEHGLEQAELDRAAHDRRDVGQVVVRAQVHRRMHAVSEANEGWRSIRSRRRGGPRARHVPQASTTTRSVTAHAASARYMPRW